MKLISAVLEGLHRVLVVLQALLLAVLLGMVCYQILSRWIAPLPRLLWTEEIARFLLVWVIFLGSAIAVKERSHFVLEILTDHRSSVVNAVWTHSLIVLELVFCSIFLYRGVKYAAVLMYDISDVAQISMLWVGAAIPAFGLFSTIFLIERLLMKFAKGVE